MMENSIDDSWSMASNVQFLDFSDTDEAIHPLKIADMKILEAVAKPSCIPLPGDVGLWVTPRGKSPDLEFADGTAVFKLLNPHAAEFAVVTNNPTNANTNATAAETSSTQHVTPTAVHKVPTDVSCTPTVEVRASSIPITTPTTPASSIATTAHHPSSANTAEKPIKKLNAASAPFVPNIPIPLPATASGVAAQSQTIHINHLTANLNYHVLPSTADNQPSQAVKLPCSEGNGVSSSLPLPFTVNGAYPDYVHPFKNQSYRTDGYQSPVVVYQDPNINHAFYPAVSSKDGNQPLPPQTKKDGEYSGPPEGRNTPVVSVNGKDVVVIGGMSKPPFPVNTNNTKTAFSSHSHPSQLQDQPPLQTQTLGRRLSYPHMAQQQPNFQPQTQSAPHKPQQQQQSVSTAAQQQSFGSGSEPPTQYAQVLQQQPRPSMSTDTQQRHQQDATSYPKLQPPHQLASAMTDPRGENRPVPEARATQNYSQVVAEPRPVQNYGQAATEQKSVQNYSQAKAGSRPAQNYSQAAAEPRPVQNYSQAAAEPRPVQNYSQAATESRPAKSYNQIEADPRTVHIHNYSQAAAESRPIQNYSQVAVESRPVQNYSQVAAESRPVQNYCQAAAESRPVHNYNQSLNESRPGQNYSQVAAESRPVQNYSQAATESRLAPNLNQGATEDRSYGQATTGHNSVQQSFSHSPVNGETYGPIRVEQRHILPTKSTTVDESYPSLPEQASVQHITTAPHQLSSHPGSQESIRTELSTQVAAVNLGQTDSVSLHHQPQPHTNQEPLDRATLSATSITATENQPPPGGKSWASLLFNKSVAVSGADNGGSGPGIGLSEKPTARISPFLATASSEQLQDPSGDINNQGAEGGEDEGIARTRRQLSRFLLEHQLSHAPPSIIPCGLSNRSNWCFVNAILQALVACPPFYNLFRRMEPLPLPVSSIAPPPLPSTSSAVGASSVSSTQTDSKVTSSLPMIAALVNFVHSLNPLEAVSVVKPQKKEKVRKKEEIRIGSSFEPSQVYKMLLNLPADTFKVVEGRQEDAEEFLTCLLNGVSDEMTELIKLLPKDEEANGEASGGVLEHMEEDDHGDWQEVDSKGRHCVTRRVVAPSETPVTPIQAMALGMCRSSLRSANGESSATLQPFFTLQLDIQHAEISSINQALLKNFDSEDIDGYICQKTKQVVEASRSLSLEELPPILVLHMKRFVYDGSTGGVQKVMKPVDFSVHLEVPKSILSNEARPKLSQKQRQYKLFAVVYHNGREATKGHYVTDVYHTGYSTWLHCDDSTVSETAEQSVLSPSQTSTPYILFYRRCDTMVGVDKGKEKK